MSDLNPNCMPHPRPLRLALLSAALLATQAVPPAAAAELEEVIVTAQKRSQSLQDVGITITALGSDQVKDLNLQNVSRIAAVIPNVQALDEAAGLPSFRIRGIGLNEFQAAFDSPVGVHVDEVFLSKPMLASLGFHDVERIEVLKGPQGTVFGRNTTGGAVNIYSNRPTENFEGGVTASYGRYERFNSEGYLSGPLSENLSGRLSGQWLDHGAEGPYDNLYNGEDIGDLEQQQLRGQLEWSDENTSVRGILEYGSKEGDLVPYDNLFQDAPGGLPDVEKDIRNPYGRFTVNQNYWPTTDSETWGGVFRVDHEYDIGTFTSLSGYKTFERDNREDSDNTPIVSTDIDWYSEIDQFTQEFRLSGGGEKWDYLVGVYYENDELTTVETLAVSDLWSIGLTEFAQLGSDHVVDTTAWAIFTSNEYQLSESLSLVFGARYTEENNSIDGQSFLTVEPVETVGNEDRISAENRVVLVDADTDRSDSDFNYKLGLNYRLNDDTLLYGSVSTGFRSGGYDLAFGSPSLETFDPEDVFAFEAGVKTSGLENRLTFNAAVFYTEIEDYQANVNLAGELVPRRRNVGTLETRGAEADVKWLATEYWQLMGSVGYVDAEITEVARDANGNDFVVDGVPIKGNVPVNTPEWSFSVISDYTRPIGDSMDAQVLISANWADERYLELENGPDHRVDAYTTIDASLSLMSQDRKWKASLWGKNLTDEEYLMYINDVPAFGLFLTINADPRTYGVSFEFNF